MASMNATGGAFNMPMMNGANGATPRAGSDQEENDMEARLNTYIYDFFLKLENYDCARALLKSNAPMEPAVRRREDINGTEENMHIDSKDDPDSKRPDDLPPALPVSENSFLLDWFACFWDFYHARRQTSKASANAIHYLQHTQHQSRMRQDAQNHMLRANPGMIPGGIENYSHMLRFQQSNGMQMNGDLRQKALQNNNRNTFAQPNQQQLAQIANNQKQQQLIQQQQMRRDPSDLDINGQRPRTPSSGENAPSPSKRPRLEFNGQQMMPNGRGPPQGLQGQQMMDNPNVHANSVLMQNGINPIELSQSQIASFGNQVPSVQAKSIQVYNQNLARTQRSQSMTKPGMPGQASPMMQPGMELAGAGPEYFSVNPGIGMRAAVPTANGSGGNHALHDYQMQLMLLEQQNKKRLLMARQEQQQDGTSRPEGQPGMPGAPGFAPVMSPSGSRSGPSPGPNDQMKRGTPKMGQTGLPGGASPGPDGNMPQSRDSPAAMSYNGQMAPDMYQMKMGEGMGQVAPNMRPPPNSHAQYGRQMTREQVEAAQRNPAVGQMQNGTWPQGQAAMIPQIPQPQQPSQGTPQQRAMLPPNAVPAGATANGRPASPAQAPAPPTPSSTAKPNPKAKKTDEKTRKRPTKSKSTAGPPAPPAPSTEAENPPPTPTPATPSTPSHPNSFSNKNDGQTASALMQNPISNPTSAPLAQPPPETNPVSQFADLNVPDPDSYTIGNFNPDMSGDVLQNFDFDSFLQSTADDNFDFDPTLTFVNPDAVEAGAADA